MSAITSSIRVPGLPANKLNALRAQAKAAGMTTGVYARQLIEAGILLEQEARNRNFDELYASTQKRFRDSGMTEQELDKLVDGARARHHRRTSRKKH